jgi:two-component system cell cycle sensor histidine kinase/response regulator CckA
VAGTHSTQRVSTTDTPELVAAKRELASKTIELDALLAALPDIYFRLDSEGRIVVWHAGREAELHVPPEQFIGRKPEEVVPPHVAPTIAAAVQRAGLERILVTVEYTLATPSGDDQFEARLVPCGEKGISALIRNITARRRAEAALRASEERLRASQKLEAVGRLAGGVAHDFNNLLTVILGRLQFLKRGPALTDIDRENVAEAFDAASHAVSLTRQLLAFSRGQLMQPRVFSLNEVLSSMQEMLGRVAGEHIEVALSLDESVGAIHSDPVQIEQVILNLVLNARDAMRGGGTLIVSTHQIQIDEREASEHDGAVPGPYVVLAVTDSGCGMGSDVMSHLFEPFFTTKPQGEGTGLGLASVYGIVKHTGGHAVVRSEVGVGSTFELRFPRANSDGAALIPSPSTAPSRVVEGGSETIVVVEDEESVRRLVVTILQRAGYEALSAESGEEAIRILAERRERIALLLSDIVMPRMNGRTLAGRVVQLQPGVRVLLMSGYDDAQMERDAAGESFPVVGKPFTEEILLARVREVLEGAAVGGPKGAIAKASTSLSEYAQR